MEQKTVKIKAKHAIITPVCQANKGTGGAFEEAVEKLWAEYEQLAKLKTNEKANFHLILQVERGLK